MMLKKIDEVSEVLKTDAEEDLLPFGGIVTNFILRNAIVGFIFSLILSVILLVFKKEISPLVKIEVGLFSEIIVVYCVLTFILIIFCIVLKKIKPNFWLFSSQRKSLKVYFNASSVFDFINFLVVAMLVVYLVLLFVITPSTVVGSSMEDTLHEKDKVIVYHFLYTPSRNDVIVIDANTYSKKMGLEGDKELFFIKRAIAISGDEITRVEKGIEVNGKMIDFENCYYSIDQILEMQCEKQGDKYIVPKGKLLALGDNRDGSTDSRVFGLVDYDDILGHAFFRAWPVKQIGMIK